MAFVTITSGQTDANSPVDVALMDTIRTNFDDLDGRAVTNGDSHDHLGGDGAPIPITALAGPLGVNGISAVFGTWVSKTGGTTYQAEADGMVTARGKGATNLDGITDSSATPVTVRTRNYDSSTGATLSVTFPVKKDDYYKVTGDTVVMYWLPLGS
jgi:hypothetical protein